MSSPTSIFIFDRKPELVCMTFLAETITIASYFSRIAAIFSELYFVARSLRFYASATIGQRRKSGMAPYGAGQRNTVRIVCGLFRARDAAPRRRSYERSFSQGSLRIYMHRYTRRYTKPSCELCNIIFVRCIHLSRQRSFIYD